MDFVAVQDRLMEAKREHPTRVWPEVLLRKVERRAMLVEVHRAHEARDA